jgi:hypothetical protein
VKVTVHGEGGALSGGGGPEPRSAAPAVCPQPSMTNVASKTVPAKHLKKGGISNLSLWSRNDAAWTPTQGGYSSS